MAAEQVYFDQLYKLKHGSPMYVPERLVRVGDVGFIREGIFHRLFNALLPADHPIQVTGVPRGYTPLVLGKHLQVYLPNFKWPSLMYSSSVNMIRVSAQTSSYVST